LDLPALLSIREEGELRIFIAFKSHHLGRVLNPQSLGTVASTLTTTPPRPVTNIKWLILFTEIIAVYSDNHMKPPSILCGHNAELLNVTAGGTSNFQQFQGVNDSMGFVSSRGSQTFIACFLP
jgi:hypothetical protein